MNKRIHRKDTELIAKLFVSEKARVWAHDPTNRIIDNNHIHSHSSEDYDVFVNTSSALEKESIHFEYFDHIIDFSCKGKSSFLKAGYDVEELRYIKNPDGTMRWMFPSTLRTPTFLNFYNSAGKKGKIYSSVLSKLFSWGLESILCSGTFRIYYKKQLRIDVLTSELPHDNYSVFTGTVGPNRKMILELNKDGSTSHFIKVPLSYESDKLVSNEVSSLQTLAKYKFKTFISPASIENCHNVSIVSNIKPEEAIQLTTIEDKHLSMMEEIYSKTAMWSGLSSATFLKSVRENICLLENSRTFNESWSIYKCLKNLTNDLPLQKFVPVAMSHSDFTPWNSYASDDKLCVYDWELSKSSMPMFFDLFHFAFQSGVLLKKQSYKEIRNEIDAMLDNPICRQMIDRYEIDVELHFRLYLLINISYYMNIYSIQERLHKQAFWLVRTWKDALIDTIAMGSEITARKEFISDFMGRMAETKYSMLKFHESSIENIDENSDLDILVLKEDIPAMITFIKDHPFVFKAKKYSKSFMTTIEIFFMDGSFLAVDLIHKFKRKSLDFLSSRKVLLNSLPNENGICVPPSRYDFEYIFLFYMLNRSSIPTKYQMFFTGLPTNKKTKIRKMISDKFDLPAQKIEEHFLYSSEKGNNIVEALRSINRTSVLSSIGNRLRYVMDTLVDITMRKGFVITFSGVDGAGKSTTIERVANTLSDKFRRKVIVLRHRPSILPILSAYKYGKANAEKRAASTAPRMGKNRNILQSLLRFGYYFSDYLLGQVYVYFKYILRGYVVVYDRYYFDFINDSRRSNIHLPKWIIKLLYSFVHNPRLNIFLYASPEVILDRKQELDKQTIETLTREYRTLFSAFNKKYRKSAFLQIENIDGDKTVNTIMEAFTKAA